MADIPKVTPLDLFPTVGPSPIALTHTLVKLSTGQVTVLACRGHVFESAGFRLEQCIHCGLVAVLRWWSWWDHEVVALYAGRERLWPKPTGDVTQKDPS